MKIIEYVIPLGEGARKRHYHESDRGKLTNFVVQLEVVVDDRWIPVVRYDSGHGFPHIDHCYMDGRRTKKSLHLKFDEALELADEDIKENWKRYHWKRYQRSFLEDS